MFVRGQGANFDQRGSNFDNGFIFYFIFNKRFFYLFFSL